MASNRKSAAIEALAEIYRLIADAIVERSTGRTPGFLVGLSGPQGSGKSTGSVVLARLLDERGRRAVVLSLDDLYLGRAARRTLAAQVHPLLATRGPPGTHDPALAAAVIAGLARPGGTILPRFDKASDDRVPMDRWPRVEGPVDIIIFEGWCVGAQPQDGAVLARAVNSLEAEEDPAGVWRGYVNQALKGAYADLFAQIEFQILLQPPAFEAVADWRIEQEHELARTLADDADRTGVMSDVEVRRFIQFFERLTRHLMAEMPHRADIVVELDAQRGAR
jgi:D-glycerate 3-kinase